MEQVRAAWKALVPKGGVAYQILDDQRIAINKLFAGMESWQVRLHFSGIHVRDVGQRRIYRDKRQCERCCKSMCIETTIWRGEVERLAKIATF